MRLTAREPRETGRDYALRMLRENIIHLELAPGSRVSENELAVELGLSRTPVREALIELSKVKIVEIFPQKGSRIALIDYELVEEAQFMRYEMECAVVEQVCEMGTEADFARFEENLRLQEFCLVNDQTDALLALDNALHRMLFETAHKPEIYTLMGGLTIHFDRVRNASLHMGNQQKTVQEHRAIIEAIKLRDTTAARAAMDLHLNRFRIDAQDIRRRYPDYVKTT